MKKLRPSKKIIFKKGKPEMDSNNKSVFRSAIIIEANFAVE